MKSFWYWRKKIIIQGFHNRKKEKKMETLLPLQVRRNRAFWCQPAGCCDWMQSDDNHEHHQVAFLSRSGRMLGCGVWEVFYSPFRKQCLGSIFAISLLPNFEQVRLQRSQAVEELDYLAPFIQRNMLSILLFLLLGGSRAGVNKATLQYLWQLFASGHTDTLKAPASDALKTDSTNEQGMEKGPCSVILEMDPSHTMVTSPQVSPTFSICNSNPRREHRGQDWVLDYICEVTIAMQLEEARWQSSPFENWIFVGNCLNFIAETKLDVSALDVCESHINMLPFQGGGTREGNKKYFLQQWGGQREPNPTLAQERKLRAPQKTRSCLHWTMLVSMTKELLQAPRQSIRSGESCKTEGGKWKLKRVH